MFVRVPSRFAAEQTPKGRRRAAEGGWMTRGSAHSSDQCDTDMRVCLAPICEHLRDSHQLSSSFLTDVAQGWQNHISVWVFRVVFCMASGALLNS